MKNKTVEIIEDVDIHHTGGYHSNNCHVHPFKRISWAAIFVGAFVAIGLSFLLNVFGIAIGLSAFTMNTDGVVTLAIGGLIGLIIGIIAVMLVAGYTAGYLGRAYCPQRNLGILYGFTTWTVALLLSAAVAVPVSTYVTAYTKMISNSAFVASVDQTQSTPVAVDTTKKSTDQNQTTTQVTVSPEMLAWSAFTVFLLFFIGAVSCCVGACWGMCCGMNCRKNEEVETV